MNLCKAGGADSGFVAHPYEEKTLASCEYVVLFLGQNLNHETNQDTKKALRQLFRVQVREHSFGDLSF